MLGVCVAAAHTACANIALCKSSLQFCVVNTYEKGLTF